jgi:hypothetical protein
VHIDVTCCLSHFPVPPKFHPKMETQVKSKLKELRLAEARLTERENYMTEEESKSVPLAYSHEVLM